MIRYRNISTGCGTLFPARSMRSSKPPDRRLGCGGGGLGHRAGPSCVSGSRRWARRRGSAGSRWRTSASRRVPKAVAPVGRQPSSRSIDHRAADVEVAERGAADEVLEEQAGGDRPGVLAAHVLDVGDLRVEHAAGSADERQLPERLVGRVAGGRELRRRGRRRCRGPGPARVPKVRIAAPVSVAMVTIASTPSSTARTMPVGHDEAALGVGVDDLDGLAAADRQHVAEPGRRPGRHVVGAHEVAGDGRPAAEVAQRRPSRRGSPRRPTCRASSAACIASDGLRLMPPASYMIPLPTSARWPRRARRSGR